MNSESWKLRRIDSLGRIITGKTPSSKNPEYFDGPFPFITIPDMENKMFMEETRRSISKAGSEKISTHVIPKNSVCISCIATIGRVGLTTKSSITNQQINSIICNEDVDPVFLYYAMCNFSRDLKFFAGGGAVLPNISKSLFGKMEIFLPPLAEQKSISEKLFLLDRLIDNKKKISEIHEELIQTIFHSWFVNFDPLKAKLEGKSPKGMDEETMAMFPDSFEDSELGPIPTGWSLTRIGDFTDLTKGLSYKGAFLEETNDEGIKMMNLGCFGIDGSFRRNKIKYYSGEHKERHLLKRGDLLIANTDMTQDRVILGTCIIIPSEYEGALFTHHTTRLRVHQNLDTRLNSFIAYQLSQPTFRHIAEGYSTGSTVLALPKDAILNYKIAMPPKELLNKFFSIDEDFFMQSQTLISTMEYLRNTRDVLLPRLMSGELKIN